MNIQNILLAINLLIKLNSTIINDFNQLNY